MSKQDLNGRDELDENISTILENLIGDFNSGGNVPNMINSDETKAIMTLIEADRVRRDSKTQKDTIWNIMSPKTEGLYDGGDLFIKRAPIEQAIINMIGYEDYKAMQEAVDAELQSNSKGEQ